MKFNFVSLILALVCTVIVVAYFDASIIESSLIGLSYGVVSQI